MGSKQFYIFCIWITSVLAVPELKLIHVAFMHKLYAPLQDIMKNNETSFPRNLSYEYFNSAAIDMSNTTKLNMYNLGVYLRQTYNTFLNDTYNSKIMKVWTTEYALSMLSAQLVNAGLWPPSPNQMWNENFKWQPIPTEYVEIRKDTLLLGTLCPNFLLSTEDVLSTSEMQNAIEYYHPLFEYLYNHTGIKIRQPSDIAFLYASLETSANENQILPYWADEIFPDGEMYNATLLQYDILSQTSLQKQLNGGTLVKNIVGNSLSYINGEVPQDRKLVMYSTDERNIVGVLKNFNLWSPHIPDETAALIFELYIDNDTKVEGMKIVYYTGTDAETIHLKLPGCTEICPMDVIVNIIVDWIPEDEELLCGWKIQTDNDNNVIDDNFIFSDNSSQQNNVKCDVILVLLLTYIFI